MAETLWFAIVLLLCCGLSWLLSSATRPQPRLMLRLAAFLYLLFGVSAPFTSPVWSVWPQNIWQLTPTLILPGLGLVALALAVYSGFRRPPSRKIQLVIFLIAIAFGLSAALFAQPALSLPPQLIAILTLLVVARKGCLRLSAPSLLLAGSALAMLAALTAQISGESDGMAGALIFTAAGLLGQTVAVTRICDTFVPDPRRTEYEIP